MTSIDMGPFLRQGYRKGMLLRISTAFLRPLHRKTAGSSGNTAVRAGTSHYKEFAELMGGPISVSSEVGAGSTFTVDLPAPAV
ncbi:MAG: hypothetical protein ACLUOI_26505 [Eisenbergiella sp.]